MDIKEYLNEKKENIAKNAKKIIATGLTASAILAGTAGLTGCEIKRDNDAFDSMMQENFDDFKENFDYDYIVAAKENENYSLIFINQASGETIAYNIDKNQYDEIINMVKNSENSIGTIDPFAGKVAYIMKDQISEDNNSLMKLLNDIVEKNTPYDYNDQDYLATGDAISEDLFVRLNEYVTTLSKTYDMNVDKFTVDEIRVVENPVDFEDEIDSDKKDRSAYIVVDKDIVDGNNALTSSLDRVSKSYYDNIISKIEEYKDADFISYDDGFYIIDINSLKNGEDEELIDEFGTLLYSGLATSLWSGSKKVEIKSSTPEMIN